MSPATVASADDRADAGSYSAPRQLPPGWLRQVNLERPRRGLECLGKPTRAAKRLLDVLVAAALLVLLAPLFLAVALLVRLTSPGPVIFRQVRTGINRRRSRADRRGRGRSHAPPGQGTRRRRSAYGEPFVLYKFRTMRVDAEKNGAQFAVA